MHQKPHKLRLWERKNLCWKAPLKVPNPTSRSKAEPASKLDQDARDLICSSVEYFQGWRSRHLSGSCSRAAQLPWARTRLMSNQNFPCCTLFLLPLIPSLGITRAWLHLLRTPSRSCRQQRDPPLSLLPAEEASSQTLLASRAPPPTTSVPSTGLISVCHCVVLGSPSLDPKPGWVSSTKERRRTPSLALPAVLLPVQPEMRSVGVVQDTC